MGRTISKQHEYLSMFESGLTVTEIAKLTGRNKSTISRTLSRARRIKCPFTSNCEKCPLEDCAINDKYALIMNNPPSKNYQVKEELNVTTE